MTKPHQPAVGIVTAGTEEFAAVRLFIDGPVPAGGPDHLTGTVPAFGGGRHHVVLGALGCANLVRGFGSVAQIVLCGVATGVPDPLGRTHGVRLGDVVVSVWGVVDRLAGTAEPAAVRRPSPVLVRAADILKAAEYAEQRPWLALIEDGVRQQPSFAPPGDASPRVHFGRVGSRAHDARLAAEQGLLALETKAEEVGHGGLGWLMVRGVSEIADAATSRRWRPYAALTAAAYVRCLLGETPVIAGRTP
ncbi:hypothetical protein [Paractinoplanes rishiriensis]|uniref:Nucleoside phosphorylase domain-containing protein n=1 Tax=Paractinoplanes rishiriensis TaxID=1050105 RepID=A0A919JRZ5_9ACTN|nr:hypothetical protein [Actinoplanes rishiriensis]GIE92635.1 hypothetical protein Ari01nite_01000 [Actinoplanes rishiriensis]